MLEWLINLATNYTFWVYLLIMVLSSVEGPIIAMVLGLVLKLGYFSFIPVYAALMLGDLLGDTFWYGIGYHFGHPFIKRFGGYFSITEAGVSTVTKIFHKYTNAILLISKVTMGFGFALVTLVTAGIVKVPFKQYITLNVLGQFVWTGLMLGVGYFLGHLYVQVNNVLGQFFIGGLFIIVIVSLFGVGKYIRGRMSQAVRS